MLWVKMPVNYKFRKNRIITEDDRASLNVGIITREQKADNQPWLWTTLRSRVCGCLPDHFPSYDVALPRSYLPLLNAALRLACWFRFVWFWLYGMELLIPTALLLGSEESSG